MIIVSDAAAEVHRETDDAELKTMARGLLTEESERDDRAVHPGLRSCCAGSLTAE